MKITLKVLDIVASNIDQNILLAKTCFTWLVAKIITQKGGTRKIAFFASFSSPQNFCEEKFYQDRTM